MEKLVSEGNVCLGFTCSTNPVPGVLEFLVCFLSPFLLRGRTVLGKERQREKKDRDNRGIKKELGGIKGLENKKKCIKDRTINMIRGILKLSSIHKYRSLEMH